MRTLSRVRRLMRGERSEGAKIIIICQPGAETQIQYAEAVLPAKSGSIFLYIYLLNVTSILIFDCVRPEFPNVFLFDIEQ